MIQAVIFDFDGTLVDTMPIHYEAYRRVFAEVGLELTPAMFYSNIGGHARETIPKFLAGRACSLTSEQIHARKKTVVQQLFAEEPIPVLETAQLLAVFHGKYKLGLASSGARPGIEQILRKLNWEQFFDTVVCGEDATHGKPAPDLFLLAAQKLNVDPQVCLVFEDTDAGVAAGKAAEMRVFDVRRTVAAQVDLS